MFFLPYLMGERSPHNDSDARGTFIGMTMDTAREDLTQAVLEGWHLPSGIPLRWQDLWESRLRGPRSAGRGKSPLWKKIIANVLGIPVDIVRTEEGPGYGGAILAAVACKEYATVQEAAGKLVRCPTQ